MIFSVNWNKIFENSNFWAVKFAKQAIERAKRMNKNFVVVKCATTPTGVIHIGNANEAIRSYFIAKSVEMLGYKSKLIYTSDDRDPIRGFPRIVADKEGNLMEFPEELKKEFETKYDGFPVFAVPDPFKCHSSWSEHFLSIYFNELKLLGILDNINFEYYSPNVLYHSGEWDKYVKLVLDKADLVKKIYEEFKEHVRDYAFSPICQRCGRIGTTIVTNYNPETGEVEYVCVERHLKKKTVSGCGYKGRTTIRGGKVDWYIEWAINWAYFQVDIEPMGKDHWVSSFRISPKFCKELFNYEPPIPVPYEFFTVNGKKMSGSKGNLWNITEMLKFVEPEVFLYFYTKRPMAERDINLDNLHLLVNEYDALEEKVYRTLHKLSIGEITLEDLKNHKILSEQKLASFEELTIYYLVNHGKIHEKPIRIPYTFAAMIGQILNPKLLEKTHRSLLSFENLDDFNKDLELIKEILIRTKYIQPDIDTYKFFKIVDRIRKAGYWVKHYGPSYLRIEFNTKELEIELTEKEKETIKRMIDFLESIEYIDFNIVQTELHNIISNNVENVKQFYKKIYTILIGKSSGPKLSSIIGIFGKEKVIERLRQFI